MKTLSTVVLISAALALLPAICGQTQAAAGCTKCAQTVKAAVHTPEAATSRPIPGTNESMLVGSVENLVPIAVVTVLGCEKCAEETVRWALQQGSSFDDVDRVLKTVAAMQKLDCFNQQFGGDAASRLEKPLAAGRRALEQAKTHAAE